MSQGATLIYAVLLTLFCMGCTHNFGAVRTPAQQESNTETQIDKSQLYGPNDPIQMCLEKIRVGKLRASLEKRKAQEALKSKLPSQEEKPPAPPSSPYKFDLVDSATLPNQCPEGSIKYFRQALERQIQNCKKKPLAKLPMTLGCMAIEREDYCLRSNEHMLDLANRFSRDEDFPALIEEAKKDFDFYKSRGRLEDSKLVPKGKDQMTGFYAPEPIEARLKPDRVFKYPIYRKPDDLVDFSSKHDGSCGTDPISLNKIEICRRTGDPANPFVPYYTRREIDADRVLEGKGFELAYVKDPIDVAFLMVQGDGSVKIPYRAHWYSWSYSWEKIRLNWGGENGRASYLVGNIAICAGAKVGSMTSIRNFFNSQSLERMLELLNYDQTYIFFAKGSGDPKGVEDIELSPRHSLATDRRLIRTGSLVLFNVPRPKAIGASPNACGPVMTSLAISQDKGGEINGAHQDMYQGEGDEAASMADSMNNPATIAVAVLKGSGKPILGCQP